jgi:hypothetical protein
MAMHPCCPAHEALVHGGPCCRVSYCLFTHAHECILVSVMTVLLYRPLKSKPALCIACSMGMRDSCTAASQVFRGVQAWGVQAWKSKLLG